jgi:hypothetical protein
MDVIKHHYNGRGTTVNMAKRAVQQQ